MCSRKYIATKSQKQVLHREVSLPRSNDDISLKIRDEFGEVAALLQVTGTPGTEFDLHRPIINHYRQNPDALEFGMLPAGARRMLRREHQP